ncbi:MAG: glycoside hydrolase family 3 C-terminal domain-containing protein [Clostridiales bacterium]|jgi:beta-glucosidase|nr:glycoside hydrolase family 3 C-terminal domain-containing protein [Clostridiales bacterium]
MLTLKAVLKAALKSKLWLITTSVILVLLIVVSVVATQVLFISNTLNAKFGDGDRKLVSGDPSKYQYYTTEYGTKAEALTAANALNEKIVEEGIILLKNDDNFLPLKTPASDASVAASPKISIFGKNSVNLVYGGSGSSQGDTGGAVTVSQSLKAAGYEVNPVLESFYNNDSASGKARPANGPEMGNILTGYPTFETPKGSYTDAVKASYANYGDAAVIVISRIGGEGFDVPRSMFWFGSGYTKWPDGKTTPTAIPGARSTDDHYLQLDQNEADLIAEVSKTFENIVVVINCSQAMELGFLDDVNHYAYSGKIKSAVWIGGPGKTGLSSLGRILNGRASPSGRTVDTYPRDFTQDPTWANFGNNLSGTGNQYAVLGSNGKDSLKSNWYVDYEEGIYVGYRYYETRGFTEGNSALTDYSVKGTTTKDWADWYKANVVFPFGYGLSYTTFDYEIKNKTDLAATQLTASKEVEVVVQVTNTGNAAAKEVVQLYLTAPYTPGGIEKSRVQLVGYEKTPVLYPQSEAGADKPNGCEITIRVPANYFASYDYNDANANDFKGYEIEPGNYELNVSKNAHESADGVSFNQTGFVKIENDAATGYAVQNRFDDVSDGITQYLSRNDWEGTFPTVPTDDDRRVSQAFISAMDYKENDGGKPWYTDVMPEQSKSVISSNRAEVQLYELIGKAYDDELWNKLLNQLTVGQMANLIGTGIYSTAAIDTIGKPRTISVDGPVGLTAFMGDAAVYDTCFYAGGCVVAASYNKELAQEFGEMIGNETLLGNLKGDGNTYSSWYAPAVNIHRSPFSGRNWEYYSEDPVLSGSIAANVIKGARSKGVAAYIKHFALNDQETRRCDGVATWANEQSMREVYLRAFEIAIKDGQSTGVMSSFNRIGATWSGGSYELLTEVLRNEWGFAGSVITDFNLYSHMPADQMIRAGGDLNLSQAKLPTVSSSSSPTQVAAIRQAAKNILYTIANSNAMNGYGDGVRYRNTNPAWVNALIAGDIVIAAGLGVWGVFTVRKKMRILKNKENGGKS